jgi:hypothetical protein
MPIKREGIVFRPCLGKCGRFGDYRKGKGYCESCRYKREGERVAAREARKGAKASA